MKLSKEELKNKINEKVEDEGLKIELLEDIEDSVDISSEGVSKEEYDKVVQERDEIREKYKARFLSKDEDIEEQKEDEEKEEIDVKEIFEEKEGE